MLKTFLKSVFSSADDRAAGDAISHGMPGAADAPHTPNMSNMSNMPGGEKKVLNVGGSSKAIAIPPVFDGWAHLLLDIDPRGEPDVLCDARKLDGMPPAAYDAIYCSHNLEHYYRHDVKKVLNGFAHVLRDDGFVYVRVPDMMELMRRTIEGQIDIDDVLYESAAGPITVQDVIYGLGTEIESSGQDFYAHKTGFSAASLEIALSRAGFAYVASSTGNLEITAIGFKNPPSQAVLDALGIPAAVFDAVASAA
jgi:hypothetical protein